MWGRRGHPFFFSSSLISTIFVLLLTFYWLTPILGGGLLGLELFVWFVSSSLLSGIAKLLFTALFIVLGFQIAGALGALLISVIFGVIIAVIYLFYDTFTF